MSLLAYVMILLVCAEGHCQPVQLPGEGPQQACLHAGPEVMAQYSVEHPGAEVRGYRCEPAGNDT